MKRLLIAATLLCAAGAAAKPPPEVRTGTNTNRDTAQAMHSQGYGPTSQMDVQPTDQAIAVARDTARCLVSQHSSDVKAALAVGAQQDFRRAMLRLRDALGNCMSGSAENDADLSNMELAPNALAGLLAEAMFAREDIPTPAAAKYDANAPKLDWMAGSAGSLVQLRLGECLAMTQPDAVAAFVRSTPSSPQEMSAFQAVAPAIPACLDKNVTLKATRSSLRLALAFALYRRTIQPVVTGASN